MLHECIEQYFRGVPFNKVIGNNESVKNAWSSLRDILENMKLADFCYPLKSALVYYMDAVYFDIEKDISDENIKRFFNFINIISVDLERFLDI